MTTASGGGKHRPYEKKFKTVSEKAFFPMKNNLTSTLTLLGLLLLAAYTDLNENVLDEASASGLTDRQTADGSIAPVGLFGAAR